MINYWASEMAQGTDPWALWLHLMPNDLRTWEAKAGNSLVQNQAKCIEKSYLKNNNKNPRRTVKNTSCSSSRHKFRS